MQTNQENKNITIYQSKDGQISFNVNVFEDKVWLTQKQMAELFGVHIPAINKHLRNIFDSKELIENSVISKMEITASDGKKYNTKFYNLDAIISVGYRINSTRATQFRIWATQILKQYLINGYAINEERIKSLEEKIDKLSSESADLKNEFKTEISQINKSLIEIAKRPINISHKIYNQISIASHKLEEKIIELLDQLIIQIQSDKKLKLQLEEVKQSLQTSPKDQKTKNKLTNFFRNLGDPNSDLYKTIKGAGTAKKILTDLVKLGEKLKDLIS